MTATLRLRRDRTRHAGSGLSVDACEPKPMGNLRNVVINVFLGGFVGGSAITDVLPLGAECVGAAVGRRRHSSKPQHGRDSFCLRDPSNMR